MSGRHSADGPWRWAAASVVGSAHAAVGHGCQDAHAVAVRSDGALVAAVADGAGSAPHSARGAAVAVAAAVGTLLGGTGEDRMGVWPTALTPRPPPEPHRAEGAAGTPSNSLGEGEDHGLEEGTLIHSAHRACSGDVDGREGSDEPDGRESDTKALAAALRAAGAAIDVLAHAEGLSPRDLACTLSCVIARPDGVLAVQIGDGLVVAVGPDGVAAALTTPERGDYANETSFLTSPGAIDAALDGMQRADGDVSAVVLLTDGLLRLALDLATATPHAAFFAPLIRFTAAMDDAAAANAQLAAFLDSPRVRARTDDDMTLVVAVPFPAVGA